MVLPGGEQQQLTAGTGVHQSACGFGEVGVAILLQQDDGIACVKDGTHDSLLSIGDGGRDEDGAVAGCGEGFVYAPGDVAVCQAAGALHLTTVWALQEESVAYGGELHGAHGDIALYAEEVWVLPLLQETARIVAQVAAPGLQLLLIAQYAVVEAWLKQQTVLGVGAADRVSHSVSRLSRNRQGRCNRQGSHQPAVCPAAASLETAHHAAEVAGQLLVNKEDAVQVVWHHLQIEHLYLRVVTLYAPPFLADSLSQWREFYMGLAARTLYACKERTATFHRHRQHIGGRASVVMPHAAPLHRCLLLTCKRSLCLVGLFIHYESAFSAKLRKILQKQKIIATFAECSLI